MSGSAAITPTISTQPKKRGSKSASIEHTYTGDKSEIGNIVANNARYLFTEPCKDDNEVAERLDRFFEECCSEDNFPTVEKMALCLGITRKTLYEWEQGNYSSKKRCDMIKKAREMIAAIDAELVSRRKIPEVTYIFRAKNYHGMVDRQELVHEPSSPLRDAKTDEEIDAIRAKYLPPADD